MKMINKEYLYLLQKNQTLSKKIVTRQKRLLFNHKRISSPERYNKSKLHMSQNITSKHLKQILRGPQVEGDKSTVFNNTLSSRQKISKTI